VFELKSVALEPGVRLSERLLGDIAAAVARSAQWHGCAAVEVTHSVPGNVAALLRSLLALPRQAAA
jgi:uncharacterized protein YcaQ